MSSGNLVLSRASNTQRSTGDSPITESAFKDSFIEVNGTTLHYLDHHGDRGTPLVMLHGIHGIAREWDTLAGAIDGARQSLALDLRGHGLSARNEGGEYSVMEYISDAASFISAMELGPVSLMGHSLGGIIAIALAATSPETVDRLIVVDIGPELAEEGMTRIRETGVSMPTCFADMDAAYRWAIEHDPLADEGEMRHRLLHGLKPVHDGLEWRYDLKVDSVLDSAGEDGEAMLWGLWSSVAQPTLLIRGQHSDLLTAETAKRMVDVNTNASLVEAPNSSHLVPIDNPVFFCEAVRGFLS